MVLLISLLVLHAFINVKAINLTYIIKKDKGVVEPSCVAEELERYAAIGWVYPVPGTREEMPNITHKYIPTYENDYNCQFSKDSLCTTRWSIRDWKTDDSSPKTREVIMDTRWEDFPTILISNATKEFKDKVEVKGKVSFSVRAEGPVEIFICSGWDPHNYPCHYFRVNETEVYLKHYPVVPKEMTVDLKTTYADQYNTFKNILTYGEWRTFSIDWNDKNEITFTDANVDVAMIKHTFNDSEKIDPLYMFMRSANVSLWKIHQNHFFFTNRTHISRFGPQLTLNNKDLCISLFINTCGNCETTFFHQTFPAPRKVLKRIGPTNDQWIEVKIKEENAQYEKINLFVETSLINKSSTNIGYWAIDDVRVCNENEVKVSFLRFNTDNGNSEEDISCQLINNPSWRPKKLTYNSIQEFPTISAVSNTTSIKLKWKQEDSNNQITYFITYKANDICLSEPHNIKRIKSNGFLSTKLNEITIHDLVPYTLYNVSVATVLHETVRMKQVHTMETQKPTFEERPLNIQIRPTDNRVNVTWEKVNCKDKYGRLAYTLIVTNPESNFTKTIPLQIDNSYKIEGLQPFTNYSLEIITGRNGRSIHNRKDIDSVFYNFTTSAGVAPPVKNLELYAMNSNTAYFRFELPENPNGVIRLVQISKCNSLSYYKCKSYITLLRPCSLWENKYCVEANHLTPSLKYNFKISLQNKNTNQFGEEVSVNGYAAERPPGRPGNISYRIVDCHVATDYCNLNISWLHPEYQNGSITEFDIILNSTDKHGQSEEDTLIHEIYKIQNDTYYPNYTHQIKYIPYSSHYNVYIQSGNKMYRSHFTEAHIKTDDVGEHIDQHPKLIGKSHSTLIFKLPHLDRRLDHYNLTILVQDYNKSVKLDDELLKNSKVADNLCHDYGETWISQFITVSSNDTEHAVVGDSEKHALKPSTKYCIAFIVSNKYKDTEHDVVYYEKLRTSEAPPAPKEKSSSYNHLYLLLILLILIPIAFLAYRYMRKRRLILKPNENNENVYESLPFDECGTNGVSNENYNQLVHK